MKVRNARWRSDLIGLIVAVVFASSAGGIMAKTQAPSLAIAFWRNLIAGAVLLPFIFKYRPDLRLLDKAKWRSMFLAGFFLGVHFACWVPSVKLTSVTSATALVATQVVWAAVIASFGGKRVPKIQYIGIAIALIGVLALTGVDFSVSPASIFGDVLALVSAVLAAAYMYNGQKARHSLSLTAFTGVVYLTAAATLLVICLALSVPLIGYSPQAWLLILAVTLFAQFGGHTLYNRALRSFTPTAIATTVLFQIPSGSLLGWAIVGQRPQPSLIPAAILIAMGMLVVIRSEPTKSVEIEPGIE